jgi:hypothetical protein
MDNCNVATKTQSPIKVTHNGTDWYDPVASVAQLVFLPGFSKAPATKAGFENFVYQVYGDFGYIFAKEPRNNDKILRWDSKYVIKNLVTIFLDKIPSPS